ncbi:MAG: SUMF1/EgtB/PvdO family nonheme iron enzyme [Burkholderiales bacterium]
MDARDEPGLGLVKREALRRRLGEIFTARGEENPERAAQTFIQDLAEQAGLLIERGPGEFGFIHLTFEEYLAGVALAWRGQRDIEPIVAYLSERIDAPAWHEVARLAIAYVGIVQQNDEVAGAIVDALIARKPGPSGAAVVLAGQAVLDAHDAGVPLASRRRSIDALIEAMQSIEVSGSLRREAGIALGRLGWQPLDLDARVEIADGAFLYGEKPESRTIPYRYWIGKFPVTNSQYERFIQDGGYRRRGWWSGAGWAWREGRHGRDAPLYWSRAELNNPIFPVVGVTWYEAEAYCNWLSKEFSKINGRPLPAGYAVRLPSEVEWERAARGVDGREYPWKGAFNSAFASTSESETGGPTAVSTHPRGASYDGVWDMAGNVWEWTTSREKENRVLRGGSCLDDPRYARCAARYGYEPVNYGDNCGFRVVVSLANSEF